MTLTTRVDLPLRSPISPKSSDSDRALAADLALADLTGVGLLHLRGAEGELRKAFGDLADEIGQVLPRSNALAARLTDDEWILIGVDHSDVSDHSDAKSLVTVTDLTHGYGVLLVAGLRARDVLTRLCALEFSELTFPDLHAAQTSLANVRALIVRRDHAEQRAYLIAVGRSVAEYVWDRMLEATGEFEPVLVEGEALARAFIQGAAE